MESLPELLNTHAEAIISSFASFVFAILIGLLPKVNRALDKLTSHPLSEQVLMLLDKLEDGRLTRNEADQVMEQLKNLMMSALPSEEESKSS